MDDQIAEHSFDEDHWPGLSVDEIKAKIVEVRTGYQDAFDFGNGRRIFRKGDTVLVEDGKGSGTLFRPDSKTATRYFAEFFRREFGKD